MSRNTLESLRRWMTCVELVVICCVWIGMLGSAARESSAAESRHLRGRERSTPERRKPYRPSAAAQRAKTAAALKSQAAQTQEQLAAAKNVLQGANAQGAAAQSRLGEAYSGIREAMGVLETQRAEIDRGDERLREVEAILEAQQPAQSEFARVKQRWSKAEEEYHAARQAILDSKEYKDAYAAALRSTQRSEELPKVQREAFASDANFQKLKADHDAVEAELGRLRLKLYSQNETWQLASDTLREARRELNQADAALRGAGLHKTAAGADLRQAQQAAATATALLKQSEARLKAIQARLKQVTTSQKRSRY